MTESMMRHPGWRVVIACFAMTSFGFGFGFYRHSVYLAELTMRGGTDSPRLAIGTVSTAVTIYYLAAAVIMVFINREDRPAPVRRDRSSDDGGYRFF